MLEKPIEFAINKKHKYFLLPDHQLDARKSKKGIKTNL